MAMEPKTVRALKLLSIVENMDYFLFDVERIIREEPVLSMVKTNDSELLEEVLGKPEEPLPFPLETILIHNGSTSGIHPLHYTKVMSLELLRAAGQTSEKVLVYITVKFWDDLYNIKNKFEHCYLCSDFCTCEISTIQTKYRSELQFIGELFYRACAWAEENNY